LFFLSVKNIEMSKYTSYVPRDMCNELRIISFGILYKMATKNCSYILNNIHVYNINLETVVLLFLKLRKLIVNIKLFQHNLLQVE